MTAAEIADDPSAARNGGHGSFLLLMVILAVAAWAAWMWWADERYRRAILVVELEMANGRFGIAARELTRLAQQYPHDGEVAILLGRCEQERGRFQAAAAALARVEPGSPLAHKAILARMRLLHDQGQFAAAEDLINQVADDPRSDRAHVRVLLVPIFSQLGRSDEAKALLEDWWERLNERGEGASERAIDQLRMHIELDLKLNPVNAVRAYLQEAGNRAPDDDRVWLGRANLAIRTSNHAEARRWLDRCTERRPHDVPVWTAWLNLGLASNQAELVERALAELPASSASPAQKHRLTAWLADHRGDHETARRETLLQLDVDATDPAAIDRLTRLAEDSRGAARVDELRDRKVEIAQLLARYQFLFARNQPIRDAEEMAGLAQRLGRDFEARAFLTVELAEDPDRGDLRQNLVRLSSVSKPSEERGKTLADVLRPTIHGRHAGDPPTRRDPKITKPSEQDRTD